MSSISLIKKENNFFKVNNKGMRTICSKLIIKTKEISVTKWVQKELQRHDNKQFKIDIKGTRKIYLKSTTNTLKQCFENQ